VNSPPAVEEVLGIFELCLIPPTKAGQLIEPDASIAIFSSSFLRCKLKAVRSALVNSGVRWLPKWRSS
jgi:hypothetical protein